MTMHMNLSMAINVVDKDDTLVEVKTTILASLQTADCFQCAVT